MLDTAQNTALKEFIKQKPLPEGIEHVPVTDYHWSYHTTNERLQERDIGVYEVIAALKHAPVVVSSKKSDTARIYYRGDLAVIYDPLSNTIITVTTLNDDTVPRTALHPYIPRQTQPEAVRLKAEPEATMARTRLIKHDTTRECWRAYVEEHGPGHVFTTKEFKASHEHCDHSDGALQQQLSMAKTRGEVVNSGNDPDLFPNKWRTAYPVETHTIPHQAAEEFQPNPEEDTMITPQLMREARASVALDGETQSIGPVSVIEVPVTEDNPIPKVIPATAALVPVERTPEQAIRHHLNALTAALSEYEGEWTVNLSRDEVMLSIRWNK